VIVIKKFEILGREIEVAVFVIPAESLKESAFDSSTHDLQIPISKICPCCGREL